MTVSSLTTKNSYSGNGSTSAFSYTFKIFDDDDVTVIIRTDSTGAETVKTKTTHYTVSGVGNAGGGTITFTSGNIPASGETVLLLRNTPLTQATDYTPNDPFPAATHEDALDKLTLIGQDTQEEVDRSIKLSRANTMTSTEFTVPAATRANKIFAFDGSGELAVTQEIGTFKGDWAASTSYAVRDLVKDTSTNNIFIVNEAHTSSGAQPLTTNANSAKYDLIVDAAAAATSATAAASSATAAAASASTASTQASNASTSASTASTQATNSANSATSSASSATAAAASAASAAASFDAFDDVYLGAKSSEPSTDNDGDALNAGDQYFNTTSNTLFVYNGSAFQSATPDIVGDTTPQLGGNLDLNSNNITGTGNITASGVGTFGSLDISGDVDIDGTLEADAMTLNGTAITATATLDTGISNNNVPKFTSGVADNDFLRVDGTAVEGRAASEVLSDIAALPLAGGSMTGAVTITTADNNPQLTLKSTDTDGSVGPVLDLARDSASPADGDAIGQIKHTADNDAGEATTYASSFVTLRDATDGIEDGQLINYVITNGSLVDHLRMGRGSANGQSEVTINEGSEDIDFRVESNGNANMLFVDAGNDKVGVGTNTPAARFSGLSTSGTTTDIGRFEAAVGSYTGTSLVAANTLSAASTYNLFKCITDSDADAGGPVTQFLVRGDGNVGIGTSSPSERVTIGSNSSDGTLSGTSNTHGLHLYMRSFGIAQLDSLTNGSSNSGMALRTYNNGTYTTFIQNLQGNTTTFATAGAEAMRIDSNGNFFVNNQGTQRNAGKVSIDYNGSSHGGIGINDTASANGSAFIGFVTGGTFRGSITNNNNTAVAYNTSSDYRLKENVTDITGAIDRVKQLAPKRFNFIADSNDTTVDGFLAHEAQAVVPEAVTGTKDETREITNAVLSSDGRLLAQDVLQEDWTAGKLATTDDDGNSVDALYPSDSTWSASHDEPVMQGIDQSKLVPLLTGALREAIVKIETLETKVAALEAGS